MHERIRGMFPSPRDHIFSSKHSFWRDVDEKPRKIQRDFFADGITVDDVTSVFLRGQNGNNLDAALLSGRCFLDA